MSNSNIFCDLLTLNCPVKSNLAPIKSSVCKSVVRPHHGPHQKYGELWAAPQNKKKLVEFRHNLDAAHQHKTYPVEITIVTRSTSFVVKRKDCGYVVCVQPTRLFSFLYFSESTYSGIVDVSSNHLHIPDWTAFVYNKNDKVGLIKWLRSIILNPMVLPFCHWWW